LGTIWNPEVAPRSTAVMDKSSRGEKLNVELVSRPLPETNSSVRTASDKFPSRVRASETNIFFSHAGPEVHRRYHASRFLFMRPESGKFSEAGNEILGAQVRVLLFVLEILVSS